MGRIQSAYEFKFQQLLATVGSRRIPQGVCLLLSRAQRLRDCHHLPWSEALARVYHLTARRIQSRRAQPSFPAHEPPRFLCDAGLGGLARWLRAAGYEARWEPGISDDALLRLARDEDRVLVTTDGMLMERRVIRSGATKAFWLPPVLRAPDQLLGVLHELGLPLLPSRCMDCGGVLACVDKESVRERVPPRTYRWLNEFFACGQCGKLFWHGTHWLRIQAKLQQATSQPTTQAS